MTNLTHDPREPGEHAPAMSRNVICISRDQGAAAQEVALQVAGRLSLRLIDEEIVTRAASEAGVDEEVIADLERGKSALVRLIESFGAAGVGVGYLPPASGADQPASDELRGLVRSVIEDTAAEGNAVILAHAASVALGRREHVLRVLVTASPDTRTRRLASSLGLDDKQAARAMKRSDAARADYLRRFYSLGAEQPHHYDLVINTDRLAPARAAELVVQAAGLDRAQLVKR